jgi:enamine deaminase RidA (YjgF/YER057c/UK114 family)
MGYEDIIDTTIYMVGLQKNAAAMVKVKDEFIKEPYPASTWIGITELVIPGARAEIKVIARKAQDSRISHDD